MSNEKYNEYYTEVLKQTLNNQVTQNLSMQAMALVNKETIQDLQKQVEEQKVLLKEKDEKFNELEKEIEGLKKSNSSSTKVTEKKAIEVNSAPTKAVNKTESVHRDGGNF